MFERFTRLDDHRTRASGGAGLGLSLVRRIATLHHGTVAVDTAPLGGARLVIDLPLEPDPPRLAAKRPSAALRPARQRSTPERVGQELGAAAQERVLEATVDVHRQPVEPAQLRQAVQVAALEGHGRWRRSGHPTRDRGRQVERDRDLLELPERVLEEGLDDQLRRGLVGNERRVRVEVLEVAERTPEAVRPPIARA